MGNKSAKTSKAKDAKVTKNGGDDGRILTSSGELDDSLEAVEAQEEPRRTTADVPFDKYVFPFENIVFEGGGNRALAYCGAVRVLEDVGVWRQVRRLAGTGSGALVAALLSVGYNSRDLETFLSKDLASSLYDHKCGYCSLLPNLSSGYGWNPGKRVNTWVGAKLKAATGKADITFMELYKKYGREVCIVVTNVNQMTTEYCHPKTTPDMPVKLAVQMSMATPGVFESVKYQQHKTEECYVDGGVLCNYPVHCYDGWYLSLSTEDSFLRKMKPLADIPRLMEKHERFGEVNDRTLGFIMFSEEDQDVIKSFLEQREGKHLPETEPHTKKRLSALEHQKEATCEYDQMMAVVERLLAVLHSDEANGHHKINKSDMQATVELFNEEELQLLFGKKITKVSDIFKLFKKNESEKISCQDLERHLELRSQELKSNVEGNQSTQISNATDFAQRLQEALKANTKKNMIDRRDIERTVGINTYYIQPNDLKLEKDDRKLLLEQGQKATRSYLLYHILRKHAPLRAEFRKSYCRDDIMYYIDDDITEIIDEKDYMDTFSDRYN